MSRIVISNGEIINEGKRERADLIIENGLIAGLEEKYSGTADQTIDAHGKWVMPGVIDDQVHFREPGLTHKAEIFTEARAAVAGGITSYMEMPNTVPNTLTQDLLQQKYDRAAEVSLANYSFFMGAGNDNLDEILKTDPEWVCGVKIFMGSSTGNMLVDRTEVLESIFSQCKLLIATHCEDEATVRKNMEWFTEKYGDKLTAMHHPLIRSTEACYLSSSYAVELAKRFHTRLHILHISTEKETHLFDNALPLREKRITAEACIHHLWFSDEDYAAKGNMIKWNPAVKTMHDREGVWKALLDDRIDIIATDHAPHTLEEKQKSYAQAPSGGPLVQHALPAMIQFVHQGKITAEKMVEKMCHAPAECFRMVKRGYLRKGYHADVVIVDPYKEQKVDASNLLYKCGWSPFEGETFKGGVYATLVNGQVAYMDGHFDLEVRGQRLQFELAR